MRRRYTATAFDDSRSCSHRILTDSMSLEDTHERTTPAR
jgi:nitrogen fixation-related uncharacterized protein